MTIEQGVMLYLTGCFVVLQLWRLLDAIAEWRKP